MSDLMYLFTAERSESKPKRWAFPADRPIGEIMDALKDEWGDAVRVTVKPQRFISFDSIIADHIDHSVTLTATVAKIEEN